MANDNEARHAHEGPGDHHHGHNKVEITINGKSYSVHDGATSVEHLKRLADIPHDEILGKEVGGKFHPFAQDVEIHVHAGEAFLSRPRTITIWIDKQKFELQTHELTVAQLLELGGDDPTQTTLKLKEGNKLEEFTNLAQIICLRNGMRFVVFHNEPTPVS